MSMDYHIGFRKNPDDLVELLRAEGFESIPRDDGRQFYTNYRTANYPVEISFSPHPDHELWEKEDHIVAEAYVTSSSFAQTPDLERWTEIANKIASHYDAILVDPQEGTVLRK